MRRNSRRSPYPLFSACLAAAWLFSGCAAFKGAKHGAKKSEAPPPAEVKADGPKGDSVGTVDLGLDKNDSSKAPSASAAELYLETLDNYLAVSPNDEKTPEILVWKGNHLYGQGEFEKAIALY